MTDDPSESNPTCSEGSNFEESMCHIMSFFNCAENKGSIFGVAFGRIISCLPNELTLIWIIPPGS